MKRECDNCSVIFDFNKKDIKKEKDIILIYKDSCKEYLYEEIYRDISVVEKYEVQVHYVICPICNEGTVLFKDDYKLIDITSKKSNPKLYGYGEVKLKRKKNIFGTQIIPCDPLTGEDVS